jgi:uncharacterized protein
MRVAGSYRIPANQERAYAILQDPAVLARCMPGCEGLDKIGPDEYSMRMKMALASVSGLFDGKVKITDSEPPSKFRLSVDGKGKIGFMKGEGLLTLTPVDGSVDGSVNGSTDVQYEGTVEVGGTIAAVGQRLIDGTAKMLIKRFFDKLSVEASAPAAN